MLYLFQDIFPSVSQSIALAQTSQVLCEPDGYNSVQIINSKVSKSRT